MEEFTELLKPVRIHRNNNADLEVRNRWVVQPMEQLPYDFQSRRVHPDSINWYKSVARGGAGLIIVEASYVMPEGRGIEGQLVINQDHTQGIEQIVSAIKEENPKSVVFVQLSHSGHLVDPKFWAVKRVHPPTSWDHADGPILKTDEIKEIIEAYIVAVQIIKNAGADGVDVKASHGYLGLQFLRPLNQRTDGYGGNLEGRTAFHREIIKGIRQKSPELAIMTRLSMQEGALGENGILVDTNDYEPMNGCFGTDSCHDSKYNPERSAEVIRSLVAMGVNIINISAGNVLASVLAIQPKRGNIEINPSDTSTYLNYHHITNAKYAVEVISSIGASIPVIASGFSVFGKNMAYVAENVLNLGYADMAGIGRQSLINPDIHDIMSGKGPFCEVCDKCLRLLVDSKPVHCVTKYGE